MAGLEEGGLSDVAGQAEGREDALKGDQVGVINLEGETNVETNEGATESSCAEVKKSVDEEGFEKEDVKKDSMEKEDVEKEDAEKEAGLVPVSQLERALVLDCMALLGGNEYLVQCMLERQMATNVVI